MVVRLSRWWPVCSYWFVWTAVLLVTVTVPAQQETDFSNKDLYQEATAAKTLRDMSRVIEKIETLRGSTTTESSQKYLVELQAWLLHRRGETYVQQAGEANAGGDARAGRQLDNQAMVDFDAAIKLDPKRWKSYHHRGVCYALSGKFAEALNDFTRTIELRPEYESAWFNRGEIYYEMGEFAKAVADYDEAIRRQPNDAGFYTSRGHAYFQLRRFEQALTNYDKAVGIEPKNAERYADRGNAFRSLGQWEKAAHDFRQAINLDNRFGRAFQSAAWLMATCPEEEYRNADLAIRAAEKSMELDGDRDYIYLDTLAAAFANNGEYGKAEETVRRALHLAPPDNAAPLQNRLELYRAGSRTDNPRPPRIARPARPRNRANGERRPRAAPPPCALPRTVGMMKAETSWGAGGVSCSYRDVVPSRPANHQA